MNLLLRIALVTSVCGLGCRIDELRAQNVPALDESVDLLKQVDGMPISDLITRMRRTRRLDPEVGQPLLRLKVQTESLLTELQTRLARAMGIDEARQSRDLLRAADVQIEFSRIQQLKTTAEMREASAALLTRLGLSRDSFLRGMELIKLENEVAAVKKIADDIEKRLVTHESQGGGRRPGSVDLATNTSLADQRKKLEAALSDRPAPPTPTSTEAIDDDVLSAIKNLAPSSPTAD